MVTVKLNFIEFRLKEALDFSWLKKYGEAFWCVDGTGSGCVCIGMENAGKKYFCKIAGVNTIDAEVTPEESVKILKDAVSLYYELKHPNLVKIVEEYTYEQFYIVVFDALFSFLQNVNKKGYVAVDFYDGSIIYDFMTGRTTICDIDLFRKAPVVNDKGIEWFGTKRLKAPEEYKKGSVIDEQTNIFTLGALIFDFFGDFTESEIEQRYILNRFVPCPYSRWQLNKESYQAAAKAVSFNKNERYKTFAEFFNEWEKAVLI